MARINIDEKWKTDPRRTALAKRIGGRNADGMLIEITWLLWAHRGQPIPLKEFQFIENSTDWIECGLAEIIGEKVRVSGADAYHDFFKKQKENAKKGGKAKAAQNKPNLPKPAQTKPGCPSSSSSSSFSVSKESSSSDAKKFEGRFKLTAEIEEVKSCLATLFDNLVPKAVERKIPEMLLACNGDPEAVHKVLEDLYQSPKIRGEGIKGSKSSYVLAAIMERFGLREDAS